MLLRCFIIIPPYCRIYAKSTKSDQSKHLCHRDGCRITLCRQSILDTITRAVVIIVSIVYPPPIPNLYLLLRDFK